MHSRTGMGRKNPNVMIVCEGYEEFDYLNCLKSRKIWSPKLAVSVKNAQSIDEILSKFDYYCSTGDYDAVVIYCDTEGRPYEQFSKLLKRIVKDKTALSQNGLFYVNPGTMQIILSHFGQVRLNSNNKTVNAPIIEKLTGVHNYKAHSDQRDSITNKISSDNYFAMKNNIRDIFSDYDYDRVPSTNVLILFDALESADIEWLKTIGTYEE